MKEPNFERFPLCSAFYVNSLKEEVPTFSSLTCSTFQKWPGHLTGTQEENLIPGKKKYIYIWDALNTLKLISDEVGLNSGLLHLIVSLEKCLGWKNFLMHY